MALRRISGVLVALLFVTACGKKARVAKPPAIGDREQGIASWYGHPYHGRRAANGEVYDMEKLTAAHRTLPFDTWVRVENLNNQRTVDVRINDRGPFIDGRIIDLSRAAARSIQMIGPGLAEVRLTIIGPPPRESLPVADLYAVQVGAFRERERAERIRSEMQARYGTARMVERAGDPPMWRVLVGEEVTMQAAATLVDRLQIDGVTGFVVRLDSVMPAASGTTASSQGTARSTR